MPSFETLNNERISLLCRRDSLSLKEEIRLITLNAAVSEMNPRYTQADWDVLKEAQELIDTLTVKVDAL